MAEGQSAQELLEPVRDLLERGEATMAFERLNFLVHTHAFAEDEQWIVYTDPKELATVRKGIEDQGIAVKGAELTMVPTNTTEVSVADAKKVMRLVDRLEELDDVQNVYHTMEMTDEIAAALDED